MFFSIVSQYPRALFCFIFLSKHHHHNQYIGAHSLISISLVIFFFKFHYYSFLYLMSPLMVIAFAGNILLLREYWISGLMLATSAYQKKIESQPYMLISVTLEDCKQCPWRDMGVLKAILTSKWLKARCVLSQYKQSTMSSPKIANLWWWPSMKVK